MPYVYRDVVDVTAITGVGCFRAILRNLHGGVRCLLFRPVASTHFDGSPDIVATLLALLLAVMYLAWSSTALTSGWFYYLFASEQIGLQAVMLVALLLGSYVAARFSQIRTLGTLIAAAASVAIVILFVLGVANLLLSLVDVGEEHAANFWANAIAGILVLWAVSAWGGAVGRLTEMRPRRAFAVLAASSFIASITVFAYVTTTFAFESWIRTAAAGDAADEEQSPVWLNEEETYYAQPALVDEAVDGLLPQRPGHPDLYMVGFAGTSSEDVFRREVETVTAMFDSRFDTAGRSVRLINDPETAFDVPIASESNLNRVLAEIGARLDPEEDILFLFLTSHGSSDGTVTTRLWPLGLNTVNADGLRAALDDAGIGWRVIVISACYSGSFIDALAGPRTLVITAARHDRPSFGCANGRDWTYFGEAFFAEGLGADSSFIAAFERARDWVTAKENAKGLQPSEPQIFVGTGIAEHLATWESTLGTAPAAPTRQAALGD